VLTAGSIILDYGAATYITPPRLFNAVATRDRHCRWPTCTRPASWCQAHHVVPHPNGPTALDNLALFCGLHHRRIHQKDWTVALKPDGELIITDPHQRVYTSRPPGPYPPKLL
jgi:hypothetical protein